MKSGVGFDDNSTTLRAQKLVQRLQEAKFGDLGRLDYIRETLESKKNVYESDMQYLKEKSKQLEQMHYQGKTQQTETFVSKMNSFNEASSKLKNAVVEEKKNLEVQGLVQKLIEAKLGDPDRLDYIKKALESGNALYESDKQYLEEKSKQLQRIIDTQTKAELVMQAFNKLHESELRDSQRLDAIKKELQQGNQVAENEVNFLNAKYEELQQEIDRQKRVKWTIAMIKRLQETQIGDHTRLEVIKSALEEGRSVDQGEVSYLKEQYKLLRQIGAIKKVQWSIDSIKKLHEAEIGNYGRLERIKVALEQGRNVEPEEISYLKEKYKELLLIKRSKTSSNKNIMEIIERKNTEIITN